MSVRTWESGVQAGNECVGGGLLGRGGPPLTYRVGGPSTRTS